MWASQGTAITKFPKSGPLLMFGTMQRSNTFKISIKVRWLRCKLDLILNLSKLTKTMWMTLISNKRNKRIKVLDKPSQRTTLLTGLTMHLTQKSSLMKEIDR